MKKAPADDDAVLVSVLLCQKSAGYDDSVVLDKKNDQSWNELKPLLMMLC